MQLRISFLPSNRAKRPSHAGNAARPGKEFSRSWKRNKSGRECEDPPADLPRSATSFRRRIRLSKPHRSREENSSVSGEGPASCIAIVRRDQQIEAKHISEDAPAIYGEGARGLAVALPANLQFSRLARTPRYSVEWTPEPEHAV